ncbi:replication protein [Liquorilactobacillus hordei]|uniref:Replicative DNA helicase n=1 Tax=Liquorilactobacillus hordei DSM 19519 TaxID=1423759 RepID=A0A0R1MJB4_9LACO|nr:replication protein [Liquorilactobacillus hordei]KRL08022.1 replicative DNA helicase [Liquorilactobacillus hordei DSM 19519]QYH51031.1 replication protein [Liquorilactobacillus hordei DSM 19519]
MPVKEKDNKVVKSEFYKEVKGHKRVAESQFILSLYKNPDLFFEYDIDPSDISDISWRFYYGVLKDLMTTKKLKVVDMIAVEEYVQSKSDKLQEFYNENGGYETIATGSRIIEDGNVDVFYSEIQRYKVILKLLDMGYPIQENWNKYAKMNLDELSDYLEGQLNSAFLDADFGEDKVVDILTGIEDMVKRADSGIDRGLPLTSQLMNGIQNGMSLGNITMLAANSGVGKTFLTLNQLLPTHVDLEERLMIIANEEDRAKWQREIITWQINNLQKDGNFEKERFSQGKFSKEEKTQIAKAVKWLRDKMSDGLIQFVNLNDFSMNKTIKLIKKYSTGLGIKYFIVDTLKSDNDVGSKISDNSWLQLQQNMVKLYNAIKPTNRNCHVWVTYQMSKNPKGKYLSQNDLGISKNVADVVSSLLLIRLLSETEKGEGAGSLKVKNEDGRTVALNEDEDYFVVFWDKNRQGSTSEQAVLKVDRGRNKVKDIGKVRISPEYS